MVPESPDHRGALTGQAIVVTRPAHQAQSLCRLIETSGGRSIRYPVIKISPYDNPKSKRYLVHELQTFDMAVFVSANAVNMALDLLPEGAKWPSGVMVGAVGAATSRAAKSLGLAVDIQPEGTFNSEALLALPQLKNVTGKRILIVRGLGGRELLAQILIERGAQVEYAEVYRREIPTPDSAELSTAWRRGEVDAIVVTSNQGLKNLFQLVPESDKDNLIKTQLVGVSPRMIELARELGFSRPCIIASEASDAALLEALIDWRLREDH